MLILLGSVTFSAGDASDTRVVTWDLGTYYGDENVFVAAVRLADGDRFATVGGDRIIRVHNSATGKVERRITGYADLEDGGEIWSMTASPDGRNIVVGTNFEGLTGIIANRMLRKEGTEVGGAVFDRDSGRLVRLLDGHRMPASAVFYTKDGRYLITASQELLAWDRGALSGTGKAEVLVPSLSREIWESRLIRAFPVGNRKQARVLMSLQDNMQTINMLEVPTGRYLGSVRLPDKAVSVESTEDRVAFALERGGVWLFDGDLKKLTELTPGRRFSGLAFSADGERLLACQSTAPFGCFLGVRAQGYLLDFGRPAIATDQQVRVSFLTGEKVLLAARDGEIRVCSLAGVKDDLRLAPRAPVYRSADLSGSSILLGATGDRGCDRALDLTTGVVAGCAPGQSMGAELPRSWRDYRLSRVPDGAGKTVCAVTKGESVSALLESTQVGDAAGFLDSGLVAAADSEGAINIATPSGSEVAQLSGHRGRVLSIRQRGDLIITTGSDHTIRFWDISPLRNLPLKPLRILVKSVSRGSDADRGGLEPFSEIVSVNGRGLGSVADFRTMIEKPGEYLFQVLGGGINRRTREVQIKKSGATLGIEPVAIGEFENMHRFAINPLAAMIVAADGSWVLWSEKGTRLGANGGQQRLARYAASAGGHDMLWWRVNQGEGKEAKLVPFDRDTEYQSSLTGVLADDLRRLAGAAAGRGSDGFKADGWEISDEAGGVVWLRDARAIIGTTTADVGVSLEALNKKAPAGHRDWRYPTEAELKGFLSRVDGLKLRKGSFLEENRLDVLCRLGFLGINELFKSVALQGSSVYAWSLGSDTGFTPGRSEYLDVLLVRGKK